MECLYLNQTKNKYRLSVLITYPSSLKFLLTHCTFYMIRHKRIRIKRAHTIKRAQNAPALFKNYFAD